MSIFEYARDILPPIISRISTRARARVLLSLRRGPSDAAQHPNRRRTIIFETKIRCHAFVKAAAAVHTGNSR